MPENAEIQWILKEALEIIPSHINLVFISRTVAPKQFSRAIANNVMSIIKHRFLRFSLEETMSLVTMTTSGPLVKEQIEKIYTVTDGWAAGLTLFLKNGVTNSTWPSINLSKMMPIEIINYFSNEIFDCLEEEIKKFLVKTSFFSQVTVEMAKSVTGIDKAKNILAELVRTNYFTNHRYGKDDIFQYHPLFRDFLLKKASHVLDSDTLISLKAQSAFLLEQQGWFEAAMALYFERGDMTRSIRILLSQAEGMVSHGRHKTLNSWLKKIPDSIQKENAWLGYWLGMNLLPNAPDQALSHLERAYHTFRKDGDVAGKLSVHCAILESITYRFDKFGLLERWLIKDDNFLSKTYINAGQNEQMRTLFAILSALAFSHPSQFKGRIRQKPLDLLKILISLDDGSGVDEYIVQDVLWAQAEGDAAVNSYTTTLHRLRRLLKCKEAIRVSAGKVFLDERFVWIDVLVLKRLFLQFVSSWKTFNNNKFPFEPIQILESIMDLVAGDFLPGEQPHPIVDLRSTLNDYIISYIKLLTNRLEKLSAWDMAVEWLKKALRIDDCSEYCYQHLMVCLNKLGLRAEAHLVYEQCAHHLSSKLGIEPSTATKEQYNAL